MELSVLRGDFNPVLKLLEFDFANQEKNDKGKKFFSFMAMIVVFFVIHLFLIRKHRNPCFDCQFNQDQARSQPECRWFGKAC